MAKRKTPKEKKATWPIGVTRTMLRTVDGKRRKVKVTKLGKDKERVRIIGAKKRKKKR